MSDHAACSTKMWASLRTLAPLTAAAALYGAARAAPDATERLFVRGALPYVARGLAWPRDLWARAGLGGSLAEVLLVLVSLALFVQALRTLRRGFGAFLRFTCVTFGIGALLFLVTFGLGHARRPLHELLAVPIAPAERGELHELARDLAGRSAELRARLAEDADGVVLRPNGAAQRAEEAFERACREHAALAGPGAKVVAPRLSPLLVAARVSGIFSPFTREAHVVADLPPLMFGATALHELAHARGFAREDEANALAYLVGVESGDPYLEYSARALALVHSLRMLALTQPEEYTALVAELDPALLRDLAQQRSFWSRERSLLARGFGSLATATNDVYLRSMGAHDGVESYGRMLDLVLAWRRAERSRR